MHKEDSNGIEHMNRCETYFHIKLKNKLKQIIRENKNRKIIFLVGSILWIETAKSEGDVFVFSTVVKWMHFRTHE